MVASIPVRILNAGFRFAGFFALCVIALAAVCAWSVTAGNERVISMYNIHTNETLTIAYKRNGAYIPEAMRKINHFMRDWRRDLVHKMDPELIDLLWSLHTELGSNVPMRLISGYRSPKTNAALRRRGGGQARFSQHMLGKAADIQFPDVPLRQLRYAALVHERGGVGYYPTSGVPFVHVDTGNVRAWPKLPRMELALLFPSGRTKHVPRDGRRLTRKDARVAMANLQRSGKKLPLILQRRLHPRPAGPVLASLAPAPDPFGGARVEKAVNKPVPAHPSLSASAGASLPAGASGGVARPPAKPQTVAMATPVPPSDFRASPEQLSPTPSAVRAPAAEVATVSSEYDDEDPDEANYQPFPLAPLMTDASVASVNFEDKPRAPTLATPALMFAEADHMLSFDFERGLQYANLYWASRFAGPAVSNVLAARRSLIASKNKPRGEPGRAPSAIANNAPRRVLARAKPPAAPAPISVAAAEPKQPADPAPAERRSEKKQPERPQTERTQAAAAASVAGYADDDSSSSGSSLWSSIFSAPSVSYGFTPGN
jgi:uncharacterized protein YcbK (DUF882 family)